jgi:hypothetical protein
MSIFHGNCTALHPGFAQAGLDISAREPNRHAGYNLPMSPAGTASETPGVIMEHSASERDRKLAQVCENCLVCTRARRKQRGVAFWLVKHVENGLCPFCGAYERVHGRQAHEPEP